ncbi:MAG: DNA polymerase III subunit epsilon [Pseudomonadota bacterium]
MQRQIILDTETTGLEVAQGNRVIEIGCIEMKNRRLTGNNFWRYVNPERDSEFGALQVHGIKNDFLLDKQKFAEIADELWAYLQGTELLIHNASFDLGFLNMEFARCGIKQKLEDVCTITDTVTMARKLNPGQKASLDALCKRYNVDNSRRDLHGALLDASLLAEVYLAMTGGQSRLTLDTGDVGGVPRKSRLDELLPPRESKLQVIAATDAERELHLSRLTYIKKKAGKLLWSDELPQS